MKRTIFHTLFQYEGSNAIPLTRGRFAKFPPSLDVDGQPGFPLDAVPALKGFRLIPKEKDGMTRFWLRRPGGKELKPMGDSVGVRIDTRKIYFNTANLLASYILDDDVTDNEVGILIGEDGMFVESDAERITLVDELKTKCRQLPKVDLRVIVRPKSDPINVTGMGYYIEGGVLKKNGKDMHVTRDGTVMLTDSERRKQQIVRLGLVLATAYPEFYKYVPAEHTEIDHIDGNHKTNEAWNFRPVTPQQNVALRHRTGGRIERPSPESSHEKFKRDETKQLTPENITSWKTERSLRRYKNTPYWVHEDGAVLRDMGNGKFVYAPVFVGRTGYMSVSGAGNVHVMMMKAFGRHVTGQFVMHLDDQKQNCALNNLKMGTGQDNAAGKKPVTLLINGITRTYESERDAERETGVDRSVIRWNRKRKRYGEPITRKGVEFVLVDDSTPE